MTIEKLQELTQARLAHFGENFSDEAMAVYLKVCTANLGTVPDDIAEAAFYTALGRCRYPKQFIPDWCDAVRKIMRKAIPSNATLWLDTLSAAHEIAESYATYANGGYAGEDRSECLNVARRRFESLPPAVKEWAGSPRGLCDMVNHNSKSELNRFVRPGFNKMLADAPICDLKAPALTQLPKKNQPAAQISDSSKSA